MAKGILQSDHKQLIQGVVAPTKDGQISKQRELDFPRRWGPGCDYRKISLGES